MATTHTNTGTGYASAAPGTTGRSTDAVHHVTGKPQNRTTLWVVGGVVLLIVVIWLAMRGNNQVGQDTMDRRNTDQMAPGTSRP